MKSVWLCDFFFLPLISRSVALFPDFNSHLSLHGVSLFLVETVTKAAKAIPELEEKNNYAYNKALQ